jgi:chorismate mutase
MVDGRATIVACNDTSSATADFSTGTPPCPSLPAEVLHLPTPRAAGLGAFLVSGVQRDPTDIPEDEMTAVVNTADTAATDLIPVLRQQIDALDEAIIALVAERAQVSRRIQAVRMSAGGTRVEIGRERVVLAAYRDGLGADGAHLADAVLRVCRGSR